MGEEWASGCERLTQRKRKKNVRVKVEDRETEEVRQFGKREVKGAFTEKEGMNGEKVRKV